MSHTIAVTHWHDSDGFSRDEGFLVEVSGPNLNQRFNGDSRDEAIGKAVSALTGDTVTFRTERDTYTAY